MLPKKGRPLGPGGRGYFFWCWWERHRWVRRRRERGRMAVRRVG
jgi:hypothetical protein